MAQSIVRAPDFLGPNFTNGNDYRLCITQKNSEPVAHHKDVHSLDVFWRWYQQD